MDKKTIRRGLFLLLLPVFACLAAGCKGQGTEEPEYALYYLNNEKTRIVSVPYEPAAKGAEEQIAEMIEKISADTNSVDYRRVFPETVQIERYEYKDRQLYLYFNGAYAQMSPSEEVLCRGAIVHGMMQIDGVAGISFYVDGRPLTDGNGEEVGIMTNDSFVENPGEKINTIEEADLTLYFASLDGSGLVSETQHVYYSSNIAVEKLVVERLLAGPESGNARASIPAGTELINVSVMDGVCIVNFDDRFLTQDYEVNESVVIYSIVDSLTELPTVSTVQLLVNGEMNLVYRDKYSLTDYYERDLTLVTEKGENVEVIQQEEKEGLLDPEE